MPTSDYHQISDVLHVVQQLDPKTVLDVGVGFGKWGILCREILEIYKGRVPADLWTVKIDGIEIHEPYRNKLWELAYNRVQIGDAMQILDRSSNYDLIICCDVIEHLTKSIGMSFLEKLIAHAKVVIITSPLGFVPQGTFFGNENEIHRSGWSKRDFSTYPRLYKVIDFTFMAIFAANPEQLESIDLRYPLDVLGFKKGAVELAKLFQRRARLKLERLFAV